MPLPVCCKTKWRGILITMSLLEASSSENGKKVNRQWVCAHVCTHVGLHINANELTTKVTKDARCASHPLLVVVVFYNQTTVYLFDSFLFLACVRLPCLCALLCVLVHLLFGPLVPPAAACVSEKLCFLHFVRLYCISVCVPEVFLSKSHVWHCPALSLLTANGNVSDALKFAWVHFLKAVCPG